MCVKDILSILPDDLAANPIEKHNIKEEEEETWSGISELGIFYRSCLDPFVQIKILQKERLSGHID